MAKKTTSKKDVSKAEKNVSAEDKTTVKKETVDKESAKKAETKAEAKDVKTTEKAETKVEAKEEKKTASKTTAKKTATKKDTKKAESTKKTKTSNAGAKAEDKTEVKITEKADAKITEKADTKTTEKADAKTTDKADAKTTDKAEAKTEEKVEKKAPAKKAPAKKTPAKKASAKKAPAKETSSKTTAKKEAAKKEEKAEVKTEQKAKTKVKEKAEVKAEVKPEVKPEVKAEVKPEVKAEVKVEAKAEEKVEKKAPAKKASSKTTVKKTTAKKEADTEEAEKKSTAKKETAKKTTAKKETAKKETAKKETVKKETAKKETKSAAKKTTKKAAAKEPVTNEVIKETEVKAEEPVTVVEETAEVVTPRRSVAFIGSECYPFVKTGGLADVMYALPKELVKQNCDVRVIIPRYKCIPEKYQEKMIYKGAFDMDLCEDGRRYYVGIMEYEWDGVVYDFIDNQEFFSEGNPYISIYDDIPKYCYFSKAALAALNYLDWIPDVIHCHDWQAALAPIYLRTMFYNTKLANTKSVFTIHNLRFQGIYDIPRIKYWSGLPDYTFEMHALKEHYRDANMLKGGLTYSDIITTVSNTYAAEIQTPYYGEHLDDHLRYHSGTLKGIVNGIDYEIWNPKTDSKIYVNYDINDVIENKKANKLKLQEELGLEQDEGKFVIGLISRLTDQKGLDLVNAIIPQIMDEHTQVVVLGTGDAVYENSFRYYENEYKGRFCANIMYDEARSHKIYAAADAFLVPSQFEPCGLTQIIAMHYGTVPIVRETGGLKDTVFPYNMFNNTGNGYTFDRYEPGLLLDAINRAKTLYFTGRKYWDAMVKRDMEKDFSWESSAKKYKEIYLDLTQR
ncbi:MAG: glycogen/starch synthase [Lachnospiraceae bacterium]|nr:glycogen/starch synthase [Lachnospiraceae bacterium]